MNRVFIIILLLCSCLPVVSVNADPSIIELELGENFGKCAAFFVTKKADSEGAGDRLRANAYEKSASIMYTEATNLVGENIASTSRWKYDDEVLNLGLSGSADPFKVIAEKYSDMCMKLLDSVDHKY